MIKKIVLIVLVLAVLIVSASFVRSSRSAGTAPAVESTQPVAQTPADLSSDSDSTEFEDKVAKEIEDAQSDAPLMDEHGVIVPMIDVSGEEVIEIGETEAVGGM